MPRGKRVSVNALTCPIHAREIFSTAVALHCVHQRLCGYRLKTLTLSMRSAIWYRIHLSFCAVKWEAGALIYLKYEFNSSEPVKQLLIFFEFVPSFRTGDEYREIARDATDTSVLLHMTLNWLVAPHHNSSSSLATDGV
jgi:hypothetical protein